jgi:hypothetical protein
MNDILNAIAAIGMQAESGRSGLDDIEMQRRDIAALRAVLPVLARRGTLARDQIEGVERGVDRAARSVDAALARAHATIMRITGEHAPDLGMTPVQHTHDAYMRMESCIQTLKWEAQVAAERAGTTAWPFRVDADDVVAEVDFAEVMIDHPNLSPTLHAGARSWPIDQVIAVSPDDDEAGMAVMLADETIIRIGVARRDDPHPKDVRA